MGVAQQWHEIESRLPPGWTTARLLLRVPPGEGLDRAAAVLGPLNAGRSADGLRFHCARRGAGPLPDLMARLLGRLDAEGIAGELELVRVEEEGPGEPRAAETAATAPSRRADAPTLVQRWEEEVGGLPPDWSDVYGELDLDSSDYLQRAALLVAPLNPSRFGDRPGFRFRCARRFGYGAAPGMVRRCLERLDRERITGDVRVLRSLADTQPVSTQGPVWYVGGRSV